jgi:succinoglycan biosynthesis transport protein ExoP
MSSVASATRFGADVPAEAELFAPGRAAERELAGFGLRDGLQLLFKHFGLIVGSAVLVTALVWGGTAMQPSVYEGSAQVWVKTEQQAMPSFLSGMASYRDTVVPDPVNRKLETEMALLLSQDSAARVVDRLGVRAEQLQRAPMDVVAERLAPLGAQLRRIVGAKAAALPSVDAQAAKRQALIEAFLAGFKVEPQHSKGADTTSNILEIRFAAADADLVPQAIQAMIDEYLQLAARQNRRLGETTFALLETKADEARHDLAESEAQLLQFMASQGDRSSRSRTTGSRDEDGGALPGSTSVVGAMKSQAVDLQRRLDELKQIYTEEASNVRSLTRSIGALEGRIRNEVRANAQADAQLSMLERQRGLAQERFVELQKRLDQIDLYLKVNPTEAESRVVTQSPSRPIKPETKKRLMVLLLGPVGGLLLGLALAGLREMLDRRLQSPEDLMRVLGIDTLAALPDVPSRPRNAVGWPGRDETPAGGFTLMPGRTLRNLRNAAQQAWAPTVQQDPAQLPATERQPAINARLAADRSLLMHRLALRVRERFVNDGLGKVVLVSSARAGEGKSVIARALAKRLAEQGRGRVLLVDANPHGPARHGGSRQDDRLGFFDVLRAPEAQGVIVASRDQAELHLLGAGRSLDASLLFHEEAINELLQKVRERYDWTVIDAGTLASTACLTRLADGVLLVVDAQTTRAEVVQGAVSAAWVPQDRWIGAVLNRRPHYVPAWVYRHWL